MSDGGPAFPHSKMKADGMPWSGTVGMSLRQYYAAAALRNSSLIPIVNMTAEQAAQKAFEIADAMIAQG